MTDVPRGKIGMPADTPSYMFDAWASALHLAIGTPEILDVFMAATGIHWRPWRTPVDRMIDDATGADRKFIEAFVAWFNGNVWGPIDGVDFDEKASE